MIIPVYNEKQTIGTVMSCLINLPEVGQIIVVDDGSTDGTGEILSRFFSNKVEIINNERNHGKGRAIRQALQRVSCDVVVIQDADLEYNPNEYSKLLRPILADKSDVIYGNRLCLAHFLQHPAHFLVNKFFTFLFNFLNKSRVKDVATGFKMFRFKVVEGIKLSSDGFELEVELTAKILRNGFNIKTVPIAYRPRKRYYGKKFCWRDRLNMLKAVFYYRCKISDNAV